MNNFKKTKFKKTMKDVQGVSTFHHCQGTLIPKNFHKKVSRDLITSVVLDPELRNILLRGANLCDQGKFREAAEILVESHYYKPELLPFILYKVIENNIPLDKKLDEKVKAGIHNQVSEVLTIIIEIFLRIRWGNLNLPPEMNKTKINNTHLKDLYYSIYSFLVDVDKNVKQNYKNLNTYQKIPKELVLRPEIEAGIKYREGERNQALNEIAKMPGIRKTKPEKLPEDLFSSKTEEKQPILEGLFNALEHLDGARILELGVKGDDLKKYLNKSIYNEFINEIRRAKDIGDMNELDEEITPNPVDTTEDADAYLQYRILLSKAKEVLTEKQYFVVVEMMRTPNSEIVTEYQKRFGVQANKCQIRKLRHDGRQKLKKALKEYLNKE